MSRVERPAKSSLRRLLSEMFQAAARTTRCFESVHSTYRERRAREWSYSNRSFAAPSRSSTVSRREDNGGAGCDFGPWCRRGRRQTRRTCRHVLPSRWFTFPAAWRRLRAEFSPKSMHLEVFEGLPTCRGRNDLRRLVARGSSSSTNAPSSLARLHHA